MSFLPIAILYYALNCCGMDPVAFREHSVAHNPRDVFGSYSSNFVPSEFGEIVIFSFDSSFYIPSFSDHVPHVLGMRSNPQMSRVYTGWIIAFVANEQPIRNWTEMNYPTESMRTNASRESWDASANFSIAPEIESPGPYPACIGISDFGKEPKEYGVRQSLRSDIIGDRLVLHNESVSLCHALGGSSHARAFLF